MPLESTCVRLKLTAQPEKKPERKQKPIARNCERTKQQRNSMAELLNHPKNRRKKLRDLLTNATPVLAPGCHDALSARLVEYADFDAVYMGGFATTAFILGRPDVGLLSVTEMIDHARRIVEAVNLPVIADADTGSGNAINVIRTVREYEQAGVAAIHVEDHQPSDAHGALRQARRDTHPLR
jgi:2-methylisocitrate lyase-like PEP mutase family enzyme